jgi:hypothetical protein
VAVCGVNYEASFVRCEFARVRRQKLGLPGLVSAYKRIEVIYPSTYSTLHFSRSSEEMAPHLQAAQESFGCLLWTTSCAVVSVRVGQTIGTNVMGVALIGAFDSGWEGFLSP